MNISRRDFLKVSAATVVMLNPLATSLYAKPAVESEKQVSTLLNRKNTVRPEWLEILAKGVDYIPQKAKVNIKTSTNKRIIKDAYDSAEYAFKQNKNVLSGNWLMIDEVMNTIVPNNKIVQFLFQNIKGKYMYEKGFPKVTQKEDPTKAKLFSDMARFVLEKIETTRKKPDFTGYDDFEIKLLNSATGYLKRVIDIINRADSIAPANYKKGFAYSIAFSYKDLGNAYIYLGDIAAAKRCYKKGLEYDPNNEELKSNLKYLNTQR